MQLQPADYVLCGLAVIATATGLFRGFSGTLAFLVASSAAAAVGTFGWRWSTALSDSAWIRAVGSLVASLLAFGIVRMCVKKLVNGLLAQPSDAILGALAGAAVGAAVPLVWAWSNFHTEISSIATAVAAYVR